MEAMDIAMPVLSAAAAGGLCWKSGMLETTSWTRPSAFSPSSFRLPGSALSTDQRDDPMNIFKRRQAVAPEPAKQTQPEPQLPPMRIDFSELREDQAAALKAKVQPSPAAPQAQQPEPSRLRAEEAKKPEPQAPQPEQSRPAQADALASLAADIDDVGGNVAALIDALNQTREYMAVLSQQKAKVEEELALARRKLAEERADRDVERAAWAEERETVDAEIKELALRVHRLKNTATPRRAA